MDNIYENIEEHNPNKKRKILIVFDDMIADMRSNKMFSPIVTELFIRGRKLNIYLVFITQFILLYKKNIKLNSTHCFIMKSPNKQELQQIAFNYASNIEFKDFKNLYKKCTEKPYSFSVIDATFASANPSRFRENVLERIKELVMTIDDKTRDEKLHYNINRKATKISALSPGKTDQYECLTSEEIFLSNLRQVTEQAKFAYSLLGKAFKKQTKPIEEPGRN